MVGIDGSGHVSRLVGIYSWKYEWQTGLDDDIINVASRLRWLELMVEYIV